MLGITCEDGWPVPLERMGIVPRPWPYIKSRDEIPRVVEKILVRQKADYLKGAVASSSCFQPGRDIVAHSNHRLCAASCRPKNRPSLIPSAHSRMGERSGVQDMRRRRCPPDVRRGAQTWQGRHLSHSRARGGRDVRSDRRCVRLVHGIALPLRYLHSRWPRSHLLRQACYSRMDRTGEGDRALRHAYSGGISERMWRAHGRSYR